MTSFGIPASFKRYLQDEALENFGESKAKDYLKQGLDKVPASDNPVSTILYTKSR